jgi:hypothetical protein
MRLLLEQDDDYDYIEIILSDDDLDKLNVFGVTEEFKESLNRDKYLNVSIRQETVKEKVDEALENY